jgi:hypothetical protein
MPPTTEERLSALEHHALLTDTEILSGVTEKLAATKNTAETVERELKAFREETGRRFDAVDARFDQVDGRFDALDKQLASINRLLVRLAGGDGGAGDEQ